MIQRERPDLLEYQDEIEVILHLTSLEAGVAEVRVPLAQKGRGAPTHIDTWTDPVCGQAKCNVPVYAYIMGDTGCSNMCATEKDIQSAFASANSIFAQCGSDHVYFSLLSIGSICNSTYSALEYPGTFTDSVPFFL